MADEAPRSTEIVAGKLATLATTANEYHERATKAAGQALNFARSVGEILLKVKDVLPHGKLEPWIEENCAFSPRTARGYMRVANNWEAIDVKRAESPDLSIRSALEFIATPKPDDSKRRHVGVLNEAPLDIPTFNGDRATKITEMRRVVVAVQRGERIDVDGNLGNYIDAVDWARFDSQIRLPGPGESVCGEHDTGYVVIESLADSRYVRIAATCSDKIEFTVAGPVRSLSGLWLVMAGVNTASLRWLDPVAATAENNPMAELIFEWTYPAETEGDE